MTYRARRPVRGSDLGLTLDRRGEPIETEAHFQNWLKAEAVANHCRYFHDIASYMNTDRAGTGKGFPDTWIVTPGGLLLAAELKREDKRPTPEQLEWIEAIAAVTRVHVGWWRPSGREELRALVRGER